MSTHSCKHIAVMACLLLMAAPVLAQDAMQGMDMSQAGHAQHKVQQPARKAPKVDTPKAHAHHSAAPIPATDMSHAQHHAPPLATEPAKSSSKTAATLQDAPPMPNMDMSSMHGMEHHAVSTRAAESSTLRSPDYSDGIGYGSMTGMDMRDDAPLGMLLVDQLEYFDGRDANGAAFDAQAWYGNDANKLWLKAEGETASGRLQDLRVEALWDRPVSAFWDTQLGVRHDAGAGPDRNWAAFGVQGLAPYWFEVEATVYVGPSGRMAFRFESEYELLLTQRLILQPRFEVNLYGRDDPQRGVGSGLSDAALGLRLRYEFSRQFAPYIGVEFERKFGKTADLARAAGDPAFDARFVAGIRFWF